jgi:4-amino-4-deoxy-L-arabinose transferase-like glycosyltransferase
MRRLLDSPLLHIALILGVAAVLTLPGLGSTSLWDIDEGLNAEAAREMLESGDYVIPNFNFKPRTAKPPLLYWLQAAAYQSFGVNEFSARLPSALAIALSALLAYRLGRRMFSPSAGLLAGLILLSNVQTTLLAHAATPDAVLLFSLMLTLTLFWEGYASGGQSWLWLPGLGCGLAALAKGPIGLLLPMAIIGYFLIAERRLHRLLNFRLLGGVALTIVVAGPWYALVGAETHGAFLRAFWQNDNVGRFMSSMEGHRGPFWYYLITIALGLTPWCIFLVATLRHALQCAASPAQSTTNRSAMRFLISWAAVYLAFFSLAQTKLPNYVLPVFPPLALLMAHFLACWQAVRASLPRWVMPCAMVGLATVGVGIAVGAMIAGGAMLPSLMHGRIISGMAPWALIGLIPIAGGIVGWLALRHDRRPATIAAVSVSAISLLGLIAIGPIHSVEAQKAAKALIAESGACRPNDEVRCASFCFFQPSFVFYCRREVPELATEQQALDLLRGPLPAYLICPADVGNVLVSRQTGVGVLARHRDFFKNWEIVVLGNAAARSTTGDMRNLVLGQSPTTEQ